MLQLVTHPVFQRVYGPTVNSETLQEDFTAQQLEDMYYHGFFWKPSQAHIDLIMDFRKSIGKSESLPLLAIELHWAKFNLDAKETLQTPEEKLIEWLQSEEGLKMFNPVAPRPAGLAIENGHLYFVTGKGTHYVVRLDDGAWDVTWGGAGINLDFTSSYVDTIAISKKWKELN